jgi:N-hydroxyarylamine O-acetyltransferase
MATDRDSGLLDGALLTRVMDRLGIYGDVPNSREGLALVYGAWSRTVPFDNIRKMISLRAGGQRLIGHDASEFFENFLTHGSSGTCWPSSNALFTLLTSLGFPARRVAGAMFNTPAINHGSVKVRLDDVDWLADSSMLSVVPLPLTEAVFVSDAAVGVEVEPVGDSHFIWADFPPLPEFVPCSLRLDPVDGAFYQERYESSREMSPFNERLYLRKVTAEGLMVILGHTRFLRTDVGLDVQELSRDELCAALHQEAGISEALIARWVDSGSLESTFSCQGAGPELPDNGPRPTRRQPPLAASAS